MSNETLKVTKMRAFGGLSTSSAVGSPMALSPQGRETAAYAGVGQSVRAPMPLTEQRDFKVRPGGFGEGRARPGAAPQADAPLRDKLALAFVKACADGDEKQAIQVVTRGLKVHAFGKDLLFAVCEHGMADALEALMARGLKPHGFAGPAFATAMAHSHWSICDRIIEAGFSPRASRGAWAESFKGLSPRDQAEAKRRMGPLDLWLGIVGTPQAAKPARAAQLRPSGREWSESELRRMDEQVSPARIEEILWGAGDTQESRAQEAFAAWSEWEEDAAARGLRGDDLERALDEAALARLGRVDSSQKRAQALDDETLDRLAKLQLAARANRDADAAPRSSADQERRDREAFAAAQAIEPEDYTVTGYTAFIALIERQSFQGKKLAQDNRNAAHHSPVSFGAPR